ncbi:protein LMBR1L-like [Symsagittifera roscoffensis]|uniref:protein LMBR1L-like n=1 Tax=Symsagittifera roscoffensis TaxID=84072 RepID=UPI00307C0F23
MSSSVELGVEAEEELFHNTIRAIFVSCLFFFAFYTSAHFLISHFKREPESEDYYLLDCETTAYALFQLHHENDTHPQQMGAPSSGWTVVLLVYKIPYYLCTFSLACSMAAVCLLPFSILSNEVLTRYPDNYYLQWLNKSVVYVLWNSLFFLCNLSLFLLLPFAYFFTESQGSPAHTRTHYSHAASIAAKVYETFVSLFWLTVMVVGLVVIFCAITDFDYYSNTPSPTTTSSPAVFSPDNGSVLSGIGIDPFRSDHIIKQSAAHINMETQQRNNLLLIWSVSWNFIPLLYSCMSLIGACFHLFCTPLGFAKLFTVLGKVLTKPQFLHDIQQDRDSLQLQRDLLTRRIEVEQQRSLPAQDESKSGRKVTESGKTKQTFLSSSFSGFDRRHFNSRLRSYSDLIEDSDDDSLSMQRAQPQHSKLSQSGSIHGTILAANRDARSTNAIGGYSSQSSVLSTLQSDLIGVEAELAEVERKLSVAFWRRNLGYPLMLLLLLATTCLCVFLVGINLIALALGQTSLPFVQDKQQSAGTTTLDSAIHSLSLRGRGGLLSSVGLGWVGVCTEVCLTFYFMLASLIGFYNLPFLRTLRPVKGDTALHILIVNCVLILIVGSALPLVMRTLGLVSLDLIGRFGRLTWLNSLQLVLTYNLLFAALSVWCLTHTFTAAVREELYMRYVFLKCQLMAYYHRCTQLYSSYTRYQYHNNSELARKLLARFIRNAAAPPE